MRGGPFLARKVTCYDSIECWKPYAEQENLPLSYMHLLQESLFGEQTKVP